MTTAATAPTGTPAPGLNNAAATAAATATENAKNGTPAGTTTGAPVGISVGNPVVTPKGANTQNASAKSGPQA